MRDIGLKKIVTRPIEPSRRSRRRRANPSRGMRFLFVSGCLLCTLLPVRVAAWNPPAHVVSGSIAYHALLQSPEQRALFGAIRPFLYSKALDPDGSLQRQTQALSGRDADEVRFILTTAWADLIRKADPGKHRDKWHYINWPFKPQGEPANVVPTPPRAENILSAFANTERLLQSTASVDRKAAAFAWLLHLVGDVHQPLHTVQLFTREYPEGDRGGNEICVRAAPDSTSVNLHMLWDGSITSTNDIGPLTDIAAGLRNKFPASRLRELGSSDPKTWAQESYELAKVNAYVNGSLRGTPKGQVKDCSEIAAAKILPAGYAAKVKDIAERRIVLAGYRLASLLARVCKQPSCGKA